MSRGKTREELVQDSRFREQMRDLYQDPVIAIYGFRQPDYSGLSESARRTLAQLPSWMVDEFGLPIHMSSLQED